MLNATPTFYLVDRKSIISEAILPKVVQKRKYDLNFLYDFFVRKMRKSKNFNTRFGLYIVD